MEIVFFFKNMTRAEEENLREYFSVKTQKIEKILAGKPDDAVLLQVKCEKFEKHSAYEVELILKMPGQTISAKEASHMLTKGVDLARDRLDMQLKKRLLYARRSHRTIKAPSRTRLKMASATRQ